MSSRRVAASIALALVASGCRSESDVSLAKEPLARVVTPVTRAGQPTRPPTPAPVAETAAPVVPAPSQPKAAATAKAPTSADQEPAAPVKVKRLLLTSAIENREPVAVSSFTSGEEPVIAFVELDNKAGSAATVSVTFENAAGESVGHVKLEVPAHKSRWRTWARTRRIREPGTWVAVVKNESGQTLAKKSFEVR
jgi:type IV secretory pathway VirB10-like protein